MTTEASTWSSPHTQGKLNRKDALAYLERINLPADLLDHTPSASLLGKLQTAHLLAVPFESTSVHVNDWRQNDAEIELGRGETVALAEGAFRHIVDLRRGGYCFSLNGTFAALLRSFGFRVSECLAKVNIIRKDPTVYGVDWEALSHLVLIVDWQGSESRYLSDVGFGSGPTTPLLLHDGNEVSSIPSTDVYRLSLHESIPFVSPSLLHDQAPTWMVSRRAHSQDSTAEEPRFIFIPQYAFSVISTTHRDVKALNHFQSTCDEAVFYKLFVATLLKENGVRITLSYHAGSVDDQGVKAAKLSRTKLTSRDRNDEIMDMRYIPMKVANVREILEKEFGMSFPANHAGN